MPVQRSDTRKEFLQDIFHAAIEHAGYGWFSVDKYRWVNLPADEVYALITEHEDENNQHRIDINTIAKGIGVIDNAVVDPSIDGRFGGNLVNRKTRQRMFMSSATRKAIVQASRENDAGDIDVVLALAIVECALFGGVTYA